MTARALSHRQARAFYDRFGRKQDLQFVYESAAIEVLLQYADFESASAVVELGCGTGRLAARLLERYLPAEATYVGFDLSGTMVELTKSRVAPWAGRAEIQLTDGSPTLPLEEGVCDRFLSTYVLDLLSQEEIDVMLAEARRVLAPGGRLCLASLTFGQTPLSRLVGRVWTSAYALNPSLVGGCRPLELNAIVAPSWRVIHHEIVCRFGICTEVLVAGPTQ